MAGIEELTKEVCSAMELMRDGADVSSYAIAGTLRHIEKSNPDWLTICEPMGIYDGAGHVPYFGAILTAKGREVLDG